MSCIVCCVQVDPSQEDLEVTAHRTYMIARCRHAAAAIFHAQDGLGSTAHESEVRRLERAAATLETWSTAGGRGGQKREGSCTLCTMSGYWDCSQAVISVYLPCTM